ncbi:hypothetical protein SDC9_199184 [bioreactor metagenome]|uniref:Uncharacterized protein n=1 Tax=bioreactor metagenome TaxID=1076179 RepID=A0A645IKI8_9ZZZZ
MLTRNSLPNLLKQKTILLTSAGGGIDIEAAQSVSKSQLNRLSFCTLP